MDVVQLSADLDALCKLLQNSDMLALDALTQLRRAQGAARLPSVDAMEQAINQLNFSLATRFCDSMRHSLQDSEVIAVGSDR